MDVPVEPLTSTQDDKLPELSRSQTNLDVAAGFPVLPVPVSSATTPTVNKRKSLRLRPAEILNLQDADPLPLMTAPPTTPAPQLRARTSAKMSLFNLFSKPKVEKLRGYAEPGMDGPPRGFSNSDASTSRPALLTRTQHADAQSGVLRPSTSKSYSARAPKLIAKEPSPPLPMPMDRIARMRSFDPPPLFQVWPQAIKHASFEVTTMAPDMVLQKSKNRMLGTTLFVPNADLQSLQMPGNRDSIDSRMTTKTNVRYVPNGSISPANLPTKLIVLVTSGYLLQYAATGDQQRYPEKVLQLQKESAAYASDLIPGKHHVLQVVQSVNDSGVVVTPSSGLFSKLGLRSQVSRRTTSNLLLVMPGAEDMDEWMTAIRQEIERQGGKRARSGSSSSRSREDESHRLDLRKTPSLSHRYQVRRNASFANASPEETRAELKTTSLSITGEKSCIKATNNATERQDACSSEETASPRSRAGSDTPSISSSTAASEDQKQLGKLRDSTRSSHASTMATTVASMTSRTNSMTSTPPTESTRETHELQQDYVTAKGPYRNLSSYSLPKRRSAAPLPLALSSEPISPKTEAIREVVEQPLESPLLKNMVRSVPNLKHKSKVDSEDLPRADLQIRPESFLADLPNPSTYTSNLQHSHSSPEVPQVRTLHSVQTRPFRHGSQSFSLPLRINTNDAVIQQSVIRRASHSTESDAGLRSPIPAATTLIAKVDTTTAAAQQGGPAAKQMTFAEHAAIAATARAQPRRASAARLSLFPPVSPVVSNQSTSPVEGLRRSPSMAISAGTSALPQHAGPLRRPASLQVRTDHAPFLSSLRLSPVSPNTRPNAALPIRSLKPSRSATAISGSVPRPPSAADTFNFSTRRATGEEADRAMPLPIRCDSPFKTAPSRKVRASASLPELDFGIPVIGLGPPCAPPPCAPLPELPAGRPSSRAGGRTVSRSGSRQEIHSRSCTPIGVALSGSPNTTHAASAPGIPSVGLGIEVGGH